MIKNISKTDKILFCLLAFLTILFAVFKINSFVFPVISLCLNIFLIIIIKEIKKILNIRFSKLQKIVMILCIIIIYLFYFISVINRKFIYYWDFSCYYNLQIGLEESFNVGIFSGIKSFIGSTWSGEYGNFLSFFPEFLFNFTNKTINSYVLSCVFVYVPYIVISLSMLLTKVIALVKIKKQNLIYITSMFSFILFPILHGVFIYGQPDIFGITFIFLIITLTIDYEFKKLDLPRLIILFIVTFMLFISRRWYLYFLVSYYFCYVIAVVIRNFKNKEFKNIMRNCIIFATVSAILFLITMFPFFKNIIAGDLSNSYVYYMSGGFKAELLFQFGHIGYLILVFMLIGILYGIIDKKYRLYTILSIIHYFAIVILFTRIQNMGLHHSILLAPSYLYYIYLFIVFTCKNYYVSSLIIVIFIINFGFGLFYNNSLIFTDVSLKTPNQNDYEKIQEVCEWLKENLNENNKAYMITHNNTYNPDKFRNFYLPDKTISNYLPYGSAIIGTHPFPTQLFEAKYIITTDPFENVSIEGIYNDVFKTLVLKGKFNLIKKFDMDNGINILIYERVKKVDYEEASMYLKEISAVTKDFNYMYKDVINKYIKDNRLNN